MKSSRWWMALLLAGGLVCGGVGCGGGRKPNPKSADASIQGPAKVEAAKKLADAMAKSPEGAQARSALEEFITIPFDPTKSPSEAGEISNIYKTKIQGKAKGEFSGEVEAGFSAFKGKSK